MRCNPLITPSSNPHGWMAWCAAHKWEGPIRPEFWQARNDKLTHEGNEPEPAPQWMRGPAR